MTKILYIVNNFPPVIDGVGDYTYRLLQELYNKDIESTYTIITKAQIANEIQQEFKNVQFLTVGSWNIRNYIYILNYVKNKKLNILHLQYVPYAFNKYGIPFLLPLFLLCLRLFSNLKLIVTFHEVRIKREFRKNIIVSILQGIIAKALYLLSHKTITSNDFYKNLIWKNSNTKIIPIGSNISPISFDSIKGNINTSKNKFVISSFGNGIKSYRIIVEAIALLKEDIDNIELKLIGNIKETEFNDIVELAKTHNVQHLLNIKGYLPAEQVYEELVKSNVYLMLEDIYKPSSWKGISHKSGTFAAALSAGLPVVAFSGELTDGPLKELEFIHFVDENTLDIKTALLNIYTTDEEFSRSHIISYYQTSVSFNSIANKHINIYKSV